MGWSLTPTPRVNFTVVPVYNGPVTLTGSTDAAGNHIETSNVPINGGNTTTTSPALTIPADGGAFTLANMNVRLDLNLLSTLTSAVLSELKISLVYNPGPNQVLIPLLLPSQLSGTNRALNNTVLSDGATQNITDAGVAAPYTGTFKPATGIMATLPSNLKLGGTSWALRIDDLSTTAGVRGYLRGWSLEATPQANSDPSLVPAARTFRVEFPTQQLSGTYTVTLGPGMQSQYTPIASGTNLTVDVNHPFNVVPDPAVWTPVAADVGTTLQISGNGWTPGTYTITNVVKVGSTLEWQLSGQPALQGTNRGVWTQSAAFAMDRNQNAGLDALRQVATTQQDTVFTSTQTPKTIAAATVDSVNGLTPSITESTLKVDQDFVIQGAKQDPATGAITRGTTLTLNIAFANDPSLTAYLIAPDGTTILLFQGVGTTGGQSNFHDTIFDSGYGINHLGTDGLPITPITIGSPDFSGRYVPQGATGLDALDGKSSVAGTYNGAPGIYKLQIINSSTSLTVRSIAGRSTCRRRAPPRRAWASRWPTARR